MTDLDDMRREKDAYFKDDPHGPLTREQQRAFTGLAYFAENAALRLEVTVTPFEPEAVVKMQTSTGDTQTYRRHGRFEFTVDGQPAALTIYAGEHGYFLPFADALAGGETYGAGRYLEPEPLGQGRFLVDFNLAYNPYCAYNDKWSCPLTPAENRLTVAVRAGERVFGGHAGAEGEGHG